MSITGRIILIMFIMMGIFINISGIYGYPIDTGLVFNSWIGLVLWVSGLIIELHNLMSDLTNHD